MRKPMISVIQITRANSEKIMTDLDMFLNPM